MNPQSNVDFETLPTDEPMDETDINLRGYLTQLSDEHLEQYRPEWTDEQVKAWDGNFRSDGALMLVCCERDVEIEEFRRTLEAYLKFRSERLSAP